MLAAMKCSPSASAMSSACRSCAQPVVVVDEHRRRAERAVGSGQHLALAEPLGERESPCHPTSIAAS